MSVMSEGGGVVAGSECLTQVDSGVHIPLYPTDNFPPPPLQCEPCSVALKTGKRKGDCCGSKCMLGMTTCKHIIYRI